MGADMDEYAVLGVPRYATVEDIKSAYRERVRFLHPDRHVRADGTVPMAVQEAFVRLNHAFRAAMANREAAAPTVPQQRTPFTDPASTTRPPGTPTVARPVVPLTPMTQ